MVQTRGSGPGLNASGEITGFGDVGHPCVTFSIHPTSPPPSTPGTPNPKPQAVNAREIQHRELSTMIQPNVSRPLVSEGAEPASSSTSTYFFMTNQRPSISCVITYAFVVRIVHGIVCPLVGDCDATRKTSVCNQNHWVPLYHHHLTVSLQYSQVSTQVRKPALDAVQPDILLCPG